jgi:uncharacterized protein YuzE
MRQLNTIRNRKESFIRNLKFHYDELNDLLYAYKENSAVYSNVMIGEFHLEFNKNKELVGIEILKASDILKEYGISQAILKNIQKVDLKAVINNNSLLVFITIYSKGQHKSAAITMSNLESPIMRAIASA